MRKAYAGWDTLMIGQQLYRGQPIAISNQPGRCRILNTGGDSGSFSFILLSSPAYEKFSVCLDSAYLLVQVVFVHAGAFCHLEIISM